MSRVVRQVLLLGYGLTASWLALAPAAVCQAAGVVRGNVHSGEPGTSLPLGGAWVRLYEATNDAPRVVGQGMSNFAGNFTIVTPRAGALSDGIFYATADLGNGVQLVSILGKTLGPIAVVNELTTVAAGYAMAQLTSGGEISGSHLALRVGWQMSENLASPTTGASSRVLLTSPNGDETNSLRSTRALANLVAHYVRNGGAGIGLLFALATPPGAPMPTSILQAFSNIARHPERNVGPIYALTGLASVYGPSLNQPPDAWTIVVKVNNTGDDRFLFGGPGNLVFDDHGYAWISNNVVQGTPNSGRFAVVLQPNGQPANGLNGTPRSPLLGGGLLGGGFGVTIDPENRVWFGNFGWGADTIYNWPSPQGYGSLSVFSHAGRPLSGPLGIQGGPVRAQALAIDPHGNLWITSFGNDRVYVFLGGNPAHAIYFQEQPGDGPFGLQIAGDGTAWVSNSGGLAYGRGSVVRLAIRGNRLVRLWRTDVGNANKGIALDSRGNGWLASGGDDSVYALDGNGRMAGPYRHVGGLDSPWGATVDGDDNIWIANFGRIAPGSNYTYAGISKLAGVNPATRPPGLQAGDAISPPTGYTLPSAGAQVLLHNGTPLYGPLGPPSYSPLMRMTNLVIDQAGNVWAINNWKPDFDTDAIKGNPGGDGICIFVGLAKPPTKTH